MESQPIKPKKMTIQQCLDVLESQDFNNLIGTIESEVLEFKGDLYQLDSDRDKLELVKDVSALANLNGGIILIGVGTSIPEEHPHEMIDRIRPFEENLINITQYEDVINNWIYPNPNVTIKWVPSIKKLEKGIAYILITESKIGNKPFLVTKLLEEDDKVMKNVVGFFQRKGDRVSNLSVEELQRIFQDGLRFDEYLSEFSKTTATTNHKKVTYEKLEEKINDRKNKAIRAAGLEDSTTYSLLVFPLQEIDVPELFEKRDSDIVKLIENPPNLRYRGFDLSTETSSKIINGELRRASITPYKSLEVWRDGTIIFVTNGDEGFLCWGKQQKDNFLRINTIALVESVYLFALFTKEVYGKANFPDCEIRVQLNLKSVPSEKKYMLSKCVPLSTRWYANVDLVEANIREIIVDKRLYWKTTREGAWAYQIVSDFYAKFGVEYEFIPYTKDEDGKKVIDPEKIKTP